LPASYIRRRPPERYREYSHKVHDVLTSFSPLWKWLRSTKLISISPAPDRLYGPPLRAAHLLHQRMKAETI